MAIVGVLAAAGVTGRKVGNDATVCQFVVDLGQAGGRFQCVATLALPEGSSPPKAWPP